jgi:hypothetical protein
MYKILLLLVPGRSGSHYIHEVLNTSKNIVRLNMQADHLIGIHVETFYALSNAANETKKQFEKHNLLQQWLTS